MDNKLLSKAVAGTARNSVLTVDGEPAAMLARIGRLASVAGWVFDVGSGEFRCSAEYSAIVGHPPGTMLQAEDRFRYFDPGCRRIGAAAMTAAIRQGIPYDLEARIVTHTGEERWVRTLCEPISAGGRVVQLFGTVQDVTARRRIEERLRLSERRYRAIAEAASPDAMFVHDHAGRIIEVNRNACGALGYAREELLAMTMSDIEVDCDRDRAQADWSSLGPGGAHFRRSLHRRRDGSAFPVDVHVGLVTAGEERIYIAVCRDASQSVAAEIATQANLAKTEFIASLSHELRTPLNAVIGFSEVLQAGMAGPLSAQQAHFVDELCNAGRHLLDLVNDALDLAKVESGKSELTLSHCDVPQLLAVASLAARERSLRLEFDFRFDCDPDIGSALLDERKVRQVVFNLLSNAVKFNRPGGTVSLRARACRGCDVRLDPSVPGRLLAPARHPDADYLEIRVEDDGPGIAPGNLGQLFEPFRQFGTPCAPETHGTGLGLSLVRSLVEAHEGTVGVESKPGEGTSFIAWLPLWREAGAGQVPSGA